VAADAGEVGALFKEEFGYKVQSKGKDRRLNRKSRRPLPIQKHLKGGHPAKAEGALAFDPALRDLRMNRAARRFANSKP
jgi:hypothetical protein